MDPAEPSTLDAAFRDHAHRTDGLWNCSSRPRPVGKGIPITKPAGKIISTVMSIFTGNGKPASAVVIGPAVKASTATMAATAIRICVQR